MIPRLLPWIVAACLVATLIAIAAGATPYTPTSDTAVIEIYTLLASQGDLLLGPYSRFQWHHPGPFYFFLMAPFYAALAIFMVRVAPLLTSPWNPHVTVLALLALVLCSADCLAGTFAMLPVVALLASLIGQTHVGLLPTALVIGSVTLAGSASLARINQNARLSRAMAMAVTAVALAVVWLPV